ncbi:oxidoreductase [Lacrimispora sphenoides]|jgi:NADPH2 dehydrogenase|uniref:oxidoreductase n=1 Tax=Lacrimispora sphenoides TaxID=29370 RepID=UPI000B86F0D0
MIHEMTEENIHDSVNAFRSSVAWVAEIGFDGIEIHGTHGYVINGNLMPYTD